MATEIAGKIMDAIGEQLVGLFILEGPEYAWEPRVGRNDPRIQGLIKEGWLRPCVLRFGFEAMDTGVTWTEAAKFAIEQSYGE